jgi:hypothetical protein
MVVAQGVQKAGVKMHSRLRMICRLTGARVSLQKKLLYMAWQLVLAVEDLIPCH